MKKFGLITVFCLFVALSASGQEGAKIVRAVGSGANRDAALDNAKRNAVEQGLGTVVAGETLVQNYQLVEDIIISRANGYLKTYREISCIDEGDCFVVEIEAEVTQIFDEIVKDQAAIDLLLQWMNKPRLMIVIEEDNCGQESSACATELARKLAGWHFDLVSHQQMEQIILKEKQTYAEITSNPQAIALLAEEIGAELILAGQAHASQVQDVPYLQEAGMKSVRAEFSAQIIQTSDAAILASYNTNKPSVHISQFTAGVQAFSKCASEMADSLVLYLLKHGSEELTSCRTINLTINGICFKDFNAVKQKLAEVGGVLSIHQRSFKDSEGKLAVECKASSEALATELNGLWVEGGRLHVREVVGNMITLDYQKE